MDISVANPFGRRRRGFPPSRIANGEALPSLLRVEKEVLGSAGSDGSPQVRRPVPHPEKNAPYARASLLAQPAICWAAFTWRHGLTKLPSGRAPERTKMESLGAS